MSTTQVQTLLTYQQAAERLNVKVGWLQDAAQARRGPVHPARSAGAVLGRRPSRHRGVVASRSGPPSWPVRSGRATLPRAARQKFHPAKSVNP